MNPKINFSVACKEPGYLLVLVISPPPGNNPRIDGQEEEAEHVGYDAQRGHEGELHGGVCGIVVVPCVTHCRVAKLILPELEVTVDNMQFRNNSTKCKLTTTK